MAYPALPPALPSDLVATVELARSQSSLEVIRPLLSAEAQSSQAINRFTQLPEAIAPPEMLPIKTAQSIVASSPDEAEAPTSAATLSPTRVPVPSRSVPAGSLTPVPVGLPQSISAPEIIDLGDRQPPTQPRTALVSTVPELDARLRQAMQLDELLGSFAAISKVNNSGLQTKLGWISLSDTAQIVPNPSVPTPSVPTSPLPSSSSPPTSEQPAPSQPMTPATEQPAPAQPATPSVMPSPSVIELNADFQEYDEQRRTFTAEGRVVMRFQGSILDADRLQVNLLNRVAVAEGNVALKRGNQLLRGQRFVYNLVQGTGQIQQASGEIFLPTTARDTSFSLTNDATAGATLGRPLSDRITANQPLQQVTSPGGISVSVGAGQNAPFLPVGPQGGEVRRLRFEAADIDFTPEGWQATNIQITNDPFSPPELILRADRAVSRRLSPQRDEVRATRPRLVFDQRFTLPLPISRVVLDQEERTSTGVQIGFDDTDRGGLFVERPFDVLLTENLRFTASPQIYLQRAFSGNGDVADLSNLGVKFRLDGQFNRVQVRGIASFNSLDPDDVDETLRASLRVRQLIGTHTLAIEASYRDRLFNNSLGFQTVQSSVGAVFYSPLIKLGNSGFTATYQVGVQNVTADTDRADLLEPIRENNRVNLSRVQAAGALSRLFPLWKGKPLPATATEGLRYTPVPVVPYVSFAAGVTGVLSAYSNGDTQQNLFGSMSLLGQFGNFSRPYLDYTAFNLTYSQRVGSGQSPFLFDRTVDDRILSAGITQQLYGPLRVGIQASVNLDTSQAISTDYLLEYSRRTYGITLRYNPVLGVGSLNLRISDFNWTGSAQPFSGLDIAPVEGGIRRE